MYRKKDFNEKMLLKALKNIEGGLTAAQFEKIKQSYETFGRQLPLYRGDKT